MEDLRQRQGWPDLPPAPASLSPDEIRAIRMSVNASQSVFALLLGTTKGTITQWEQGLRRPTGPALKLLDLVRKKGLSILY